MGAITVKYNGGTALPRNVGTYVVTVDIEAGGAFAPVAGLYIGTFEITPAPYFISFTPNHKTYDGYDTATIDYSSFQQSGVIGSDVVSLEKAINAYQYKFPQSAAGNNLQVTMVGAKLVGAAAQNYEIRYNTSTTVANINKRVLNLTTAKNQYERDYIAGDNSVALTFDKYEDLDGVLSFDRRTVKIDSVIGYVNMNSIGVGTRSIETVNVVLSGENSQNYTYTITNLPSLTLRINQAHPVGITAAPDIAPVTYNGYRTLSSLPIPGNTQSRWQWVNPAAIPQVVNSGYDIRYNPGDANYLTVTYTATVEVYPATLTVRIDKISDVTYGNETPQFTAVFNGLSGSDTVDDIGGTLVINTTYTQGSPVGAYSAVVDDSLLFSTNYNVVFDSTTGKFNVVPKEISIEPTASNRVYSEGNRYVNVYYGALNGVIAGDNVFINNGSGADIGNNPVIGEMSNENAGTGKAVYYPVPALGGTDSANYSLIYPASITVDIAQAVPTYSPPNSASINFGQRLSAAVFSGGSGDGIFIYENPDYIPTAVGTISEIYVQFIPTNSNYRTERYRVPLTVKASQPAFTVSINGSFNIGETLHAATDLDSTARQYATYKWYYAEGGTIIGTPIHEGTSYTLTQADIDKHIVLVVTLQSPYEGERTFYATQRVQEENLTFWQKLARWWYRLISAIQGIFGII